ncbi:periplasmic heavy metal sensor [Halodurantibacterium flavum]|uniref:Periplasmic heavy metal sensor n=1 Tax=Halodurantibacterium flavum TaxID=1382802 RepID=A0ABW4S2F8_9RHOB
MAEPHETARAPRRPRAPRWMQILLFLSLAVNLVGLGVLAGGVITRGGPGGPPPVVLRDISLGAYSEALSPEDRAALRSAFRQNVPALRDLRDQQRAEQARLLEALRAQPFSPDAVAAILETQRGRLLRATEIGHGALLARLTEMDNAARAGFADRLEEALARRPGPGGGGPGRRHGDAPQP